PLVVADSWRSVRWTTAFINRIVAIMVKNTEAGLRAAALGQTASSLKVVFFAEAAERADGTIPAHAGTHDRAFIKAVAAVVEQEPHRIMTSPTAAKALKERLAARAAVPGRAGDKPLAVAAKV